jgi:hypothetical protein
MMEAKVAMWVNGVSAFAERTAGDAGRDGPLTQVTDGVEGPGIPYSDIVGLRQGFGATFRGKAFHDNWFHFAIPTPVILPVFLQARQAYDPGRRLKLEQVFVLFKNYVSPRGGALAQIRQVDVWDGGQTRFNTHLIPEPPGRAPGGIPIGGDVPEDPEPLPPDPYRGDHHLGIHGGWNAWTVSDAQNNLKPPVQFGICISVLVHFSADIDIRFAAAGADFILEVP